ncbi:hypothetical protein EU537_05325 [Candidatus Thorarchaeota archaeon]|nr:MAG: hypothetical protein EU537_05325 [Candidatus Thorarchaeota archaeon]
MVVSEKFVLPLAQLTKFICWIVTFYILDMRIRMSEAVYFAATPFLYFIIAVAELGVGLAALFPREESWNWTLIVVIFSIVLGLAPLLQLLGGSLPDEQVSILGLIAELISLTEIFVLRDKRIIKRYNVRF